MGFCRHRVERVLSIPPDRDQSLILTERADFEFKHPALCPQIRELQAQRVTLGLHLLDSFPEHFRRRAGWRDLIQTRPGERIVPGESHGAIAVIFRAGWRALSAEAVARIQAPESAVIVDPTRFVVDDTRCPCHRLARTDSSAVPARVVDERHPEHVFQLMRQLIFAPLSQRLAPNSLNLSNDTE